MYPELLADAFRSVIARRGLMAVCLPAGEPSAEEHPRGPPTRIDVAVVLEEVPEGTPADVVVCLPEGDLDAWERATEVLVVGPEGQTSVEVTDLEALVDLIVNLTAESKATEEQR